MSRKRRLAIASVVSLVLSTIGPAMQPAAALEFGFESAARFGGAASETVITLRGEILEGDASVLQRFVVANRDRWLADGATVVPVIDGGDVEEAILIGAFLRDALTEIRLPDTGSSRCASACFFLLAQAVERHAIAGTVGMHRPFFDRYTMAGASPEAAHRRYAELLAGLRAQLIGWAVPHALIERMFATPSSAMYRLSAGDLVQLGVYPPWFAEYAAARCNLDVHAAEHLAEMRTLGDASGVAALEQSEADAAHCLAQLRRRAREVTLDAAAAN